MEETEKEKVGTFEEAPGQSSSMRVMSFVALLASIGITAVDILGYDKGGNAIVYVVMFLVAAFVPKAVQKFAENIPKK